MISSVQRQCNGINLTRQHIFFTFSRLTLRYQFHYDSWLIPLEILKRIAVNNRLSIWLIITESERKLNFLSVSTGGIKKASNTSALSVSQMSPVRFICHTTLPRTNISKDVFERRTSTGSEAFSLFICLDTNKLVLLKGDLPESFNETTPQ